MENVLIHAFQRINILSRYVGGTDLFIIIIELEWLYYCMYNINFVTIEIIKMVHHWKLQRLFSKSEIAEERLHLFFDHRSKIFSRVEFEIGRAIVHFFRFWPNRKLLSCLHDFEYRRRTEVLLHTVNRSLRQISGILGNLQYVKTSSQLINFLDVLFERIECLWIRTRLRRASPKIVNKLIPAYIR